IAAMTRRRWMWVTMCVEAAQRAASTHIDPYIPLPRDNAAMLRAGVSLDGNVDSLASAGAEVVGTLSVHGNGYASKSFVLATAAEEGARAGGTHVIVAATDTSVSSEQITPDRATTTVTGRTATTTFTPGATMRVSRHSGG